MIKQDIAKEPGAPLVAGFSVIAWSASFGWTRPTLHRFPSKLLPTSSIFSCADLFPGHRLPPVRVPTNLQWEVEEVIERSLPMTANGMAGPCSAVNLLDRGHRPFSAH